MSISFESAVATLKSMFPEWDEETLSTILMSNNYHVEQTIETVLSMGDTTGGDSQSRGSTTSPQTVPYAAPAPAPTSRHQSPPTQRAPSSSSSGNPRNRGLKCDLPDDFLRPPNYQSKHTILADEELALMLQNEMFQAEARRVLGEDFMREAYGEDYAVGGSRPGPRRAASGRVQPASSAQQDGDLGIVKALGSMGAAAKRSLTQLAQRFNSNDSSSNPAHYPTGNQPPSHGSTPGQGQGQTVRRRRGSGSGRRKGAFNDLEDDDEEGTEIITFSSNGRSHMLQGGGSSSGAPPAYADGEDDEEDSANPLLARQTTNQVI